MCDSVKKGCDYEGRDFGATYIDTCCIDGYLWDLDSCDEPGGLLSSGGESPCPKCNTLEFLKSAKDEAESCSLTEIGFCGGGESYTGADIWLMAVKKAGSMNPEATLAALKEIKIVEALVPGSGKNGFMVQRHIYESL